MSKTSYGILVFKEERGKVFALLAHPGGPFWASKDLWTIPKGEPQTAEDEITTAKREFSEETGITVTAGELIDLGSLTQSTAKVNRIWALRSDPPLDTFSSNDFEMEWPPRSGKLQRFPEIDRIAWFDTSVAKTKLFPNQREFIERLETALKGSSN